MRVLLDTHALLWSTINPRMLGRRASRVLADQQNVILISAVSAWEIATKVRLGKLSGAGKLERDFLELMEGAGYTLLPISVEHALRAGRFSAPHRDPFDRMLAAQALSGDIPILSKDAKLDVFGVRRIW